MSVLGVESLCHDLAEIEGTVVCGSKNFDKIYKQSWCEAKSLISYAVNDLQTSISKGPCQFILQLNPMRKVARRKPSLIKSLKQSYDPSLFNFTKINASEIMFRICIRMETSCQGVKLLEGNVIINNAPICPYHSLIIPQMNDNLPQIVNFDGLVIVLAIMRLSSSRFLRIGFNSLGAMASVNHLHFHMYYLDQTLPIENATCLKLNGDLCILSNYFVPGFAFELPEGSNIQDWARNIMSFIDILLEENICHNIYVTKVKGNHPSKPYSTIRVCIWPRDDFYGEKDINGFATAVCELAGHVPIYDSQLWGKLSEEEIIEALARICKTPYEKIIAKLKINQSSYFAV